MTYVLLVHCKRPLLRRSPKRWQPWTFYCIAGNGRVLTRSAESYSNRGDAEAAVEVAHPGLEVRS